MFSTWMKNKLKYNFNAFNAVSLGKNYSRFFFVGEHFVVLKVSQTLLKQKRIFCVGIHIPEVAIYYNNGTKLSSLNFFSVIIIFILTT